MMPENVPQPHGKDTGPSPVQTAANMADAITFLIQIAMRAGMQNVACKLASVRNELRSMSAETDGAGADQRFHPGRHRGNRMNRPN